MKTLIPTQLIVGPEPDNVLHVELLLQTTFCKKENQQKQAQKECFCSDCRKIKQRQHPSLLWLSPEKDYTVEIVEAIFEKAHFSLDPDQLYFFVLERAETLTHATANKLLKILEEPPQGYNFILITSNEDSLPVTILSRCHVERLAAHANSTTEHSFLKFFQNKALLNDPIAFEQALKSNRFTDSQSKMLAHELLHHFIEQALEQYRKPEAEQQDSHSLEKIIHFLKEKLLKPPQSGSSDLFWKNVYLQFPRT